MTEATEEFFASLPARAPAVLHAAIGGVLQIDLSHGDRTEHWQVRMGPGSAEVSRGTTRADATWSCDADLFDSLARGVRQSIATMLRNDSTIHGDIRFFLLFRAFFPAPPGTRDPRLAAREAADRERPAAAATREGADRESPATAAGGEPAGGEAGWAG